MKDHEEVGPLSRGMMFQSLSAPLQNGDSLCPRSCSRTAIGGPYDPLSPRGAIRGFHVPLAEVRRVRCLLLTGRRLGHETRSLQARLPSPVPFGSSVKAISACWSLRSLAQIQLISPCRLSSTHPAYGYQKGTPLAIDTPRLAASRCVVGVALYSDS